MSAAISPSHQVDPDQLVPLKRAAGLIGLEVQTLRNWRCMGRCPVASYEISNRVFYRLGDLIAFRDQARHDPPEKPRRGRPSKADLAARREVRQ